MHPEQVVIGRGLQPATRAASVEMAWRSPLVCREHGTSRTFMCSCILIAGLMFASFLDC